MGQEGCSTICWTVYISRAAYFLSFLSVTLILAHQLPGLTKNQLIDKSDFFSDSLEGIEVRSRMCFVNFFSTASIDSLAERNVFDCSNYLSPGFVGFIGSHLPSYIFYLGFLGKFVLSAYSDHHFILQSAVRT